MPKQNRVTPYGEIIATNARGDFMGNRGILHDDQQRLVHFFKNKAWIICRLDFKERRRVVMSPVRTRNYFFLMKPRPWLRDIDRVSSANENEHRCFEMYGLPPTQS